MNSNKLKILVVDDDPMLAEIIKTTFESFGCETYVVKDGLDALQFIFENRVSLIFSDIQMPQMDGISLLKAIRAQGLKIPVYFMTGYSDYTMAEIDKLNGAGLLKKPFTREALQEIATRFSYLARRAA